MKPEHFDPQAILADLLGSTAALHSVLGVFAGWHQSTLAELRAADKAGDRARLGQIAHSVRGALLQLHASRGAALASELEQACRQGDAACQPALAALRDELAAVAADIDDWLTRNAAA